MSREPRWESVDALLEWLTTAAPIEAAHAAANRRVNAEFHAGLARWLLTLALLGEWRLGHRAACAAAASRLLRVDPDSPVVARLRRERPDIVKELSEVQVPASLAVPEEPGPRLARITAALADPLARNDLPRFARACRQAGEEVLPIALG